MAVEVEPGAQRRTTVKRRSPSVVTRKVEFEQAHEPFEYMLHYVARGKSNAHFQSPWNDDHVSELCLLRLDDIEDVFFGAEANAETRRFHDWLGGLAQRVHRHHDLQAAKALYAVAVEAAGNVLALYQWHRELFDQITPHRKTLPCLFSIHPKSGDVARQMLRDARLGTQTDQAQHVNSRAYFTSDRSAMVYARAILTYIRLNRGAESRLRQQAKWQRYEQEHSVVVEVLPFPKCMRAVRRLPQVLTPVNVREYWQVGKQIIQDELPDFHLRPEWEPYRDKRQYANGAKRGVIQHAIFKDILAALKTIAGSSQQERSSR